MRTKVVSLKNGSRVVLYFSESDMKWVADRDQAADDFYRQILIGTSSKAKTIRKYYYEATVMYTRKKLKNMINDGKIDQAYNLVVTALINREQDI